MPNGGLTPDCVHCKFYSGEPYQKNEQPYCNYHHMNLAAPIRAFCSHYGDPEPLEIDWLDEKLDRTELQEDMMFVWLGGHEIRFFYVPLVPLSEYQTWDEDKFISEYKQLSNKYLTDEHL